MLRVQAYAVRHAKAKLVPFDFFRREPGDHDVLVECLYCGICHSDIHQARNEWGTSKYPMVPGHEIVGRVISTGAKVRRFKAGDRVGVGCFVDSCRQCPSCKAGLEQYCEQHISFTYNGTEQDKRTPTYGGYSSHIVVNENYILKIPQGIPLAAAAPLLCAGITTYSPLKHFKAGKNQKVGVVGLGGLGHMAVKFAAAMGAEVTVFSTSKSKAGDARRFGARRFVQVEKDDAFKSLAHRFHLILDTASAGHPLERYLELLRRDGTMVLLGIPEASPVLDPFALIGKRRKIAGSLIGGIRETQDMLDECARKKIAADIELIPVQRVNEAYRRTLRGEVRYRFVLDLKTL